MTRRSFLTLACSVLMLSACGFKLRGQQDYAFKRLYVSGGSAAASARLTRIVQGGSDTVVVSSIANETRPPSIRRFLMNLSDTMSRLRSGSRTDFSASSTAASVMATGLSYQC